MGRVRVGAFGGWVVSDCCGGLCVMCVGVCEGVDVFHSTSI